MKILRNIVLAFFVVACLAYVNIIIPKPQQVVATTQSQFNGNLAQVWTGIPDGQGGTFTMHIGGEEHPDCSTQIVNNLSSYAGGFNMFTRDTTKTIHVTFGSQSYYCPTSDLLADGPDGHKCKVNPQGLQTVNHDLTPNEYFQWQPNAVQMNNCGMTQWDMSFQVKDNNGNVVFSSGDMNQPGISDQAYWTFCFAGNNGQKNWCTVSTPTPTPTTPVTPTPTTPVTPTPTTPITPTPTTPVTPTPTPVCTTPTTCQTPPEGCFYQNQSTCSCGQLVCITQIPGCSGSNCNVTVTINNSNNQSQTQNQQQQQQQEQNMQAVLGASVAPASNASSLPSTGTGADVLLGLFGLIPLGLKLRKFV